jgi:hypothetical protein
MSQNRALKAVITIGLAGSLMSVIGCSSDKRHDVGQAALRSAVAFAGKHELVNRGIDVDGRLTCRSSDEGGGSFSIRCSGHEVGGAPILLTGKGARNDHGTTVGSFDATVGGRSIFTKSCLGNC